MNEISNSSFQKEKLLSNSYEKTIDEQNNNNSNNEEKKYLNYYNESFINKIFFRWTTRIIDLSNEKKLKISDINSLHDNQKIKNHIKQLEEKWKENSSNKNSKYPLLKIIFNIHKYELIKLFIIDFSLQTLKIIRMFFFRQIIFLFSKGEFEGTKINNFKNKSLLEFIKNYQFSIYQCGFIFISTKLLGTILFHNFEFKNLMMQRRIKNEMTGLLFNKILRSNLYNYEGKDEGEKINLIEVDCEKLGFIFTVGPKIINAPYIIILSLYFLFQLFGFKFIYAMIILIILISFILFLQILYLRNMRKILIKKDERMKLVTYVFHILKNIKINGWENEWAKKIKNKRDDELLYIKKNLYIGLIRLLVNSNIPLILLMVSIGTYIYSNKTLEIANLFTAFQLINQMTNPLMGIPMFLNDFFTNLISIKRLQDFLYSEEHNYNKNENSNEKDILIKYNKATFGINISSNQIEKEKKLEIDRKKTNDSKNQSLSYEINKGILLNDITLTIKKGEFIAILGNTGSGKSNLINSILNNYKLISSNNPIIINGNLSYCPQLPWIMEDTIKNNIILYNEFNEEKYNKIINICQLKKDFENFNKGDLTYINLSGNNISGGQKGRISLARCLYKNADLYLLDDPLANVDTEVSNNIFKNAFVDFLNGKCRILVTHDVNNLQYVDKIILMDKGYITFIGNYYDFVMKFGENYVVDYDDYEDENLAFNKKRSKSSVDNNDSFNNSYINYQDNKFIISESEKSNIVIEKNPLLLSDDKYKKGKFSFSKYNSFINLQGGYFIFLLLIICMLGARFANSYRSIYISSWSKSRKEIEKNEKEKKEININSQINNFYIYVKISTIGIFLNFLIEFIHSYITLYSQRNLHESIVYKFLRAPINLFHDLVPIGQLLNRLTKDIDLIQRIIRGITNFAKALFTVTASIFVCYIYNKFTLFLSPLLIISTFSLTKYFINCARNLQRLERISYSPIITILSESIRGVEVIRTAKIEENFRDKLYKKLDDNFSVHIFLEGSKKWYVQRLRYSSHFFFGLIIIFILFRKEFFSPQAIGLILQNSEEFSNELANILNFFSNIEISMISIERCESALNTISEKIPNKNEEIIINDKWPSKGKIEFINFSTKYRPFTPLILKNINLKIKPSEKIGIVGRTGSGKSSLILSLCRILESVNGKILIDNIDISKINLDFLRQNITIVSQEPFILEGTLRENIDPLFKYKDNEILEILDSFNLFKDVINSKKRLNFFIKENGNNLSFGEKQLICFARAAMKKSKVVILDEATSSLDSKTESIIQKNLGILFKDCTIIMIAHHIQMVKKCKKIIVIDNGEIVENDTYDTLINNKKSKFYTLYSESLPYMK